MNKSLLIFTLFIILLPSDLLAKTCVKYDSGGRKIYYACPEPEISVYPTWTIQTTTTAGVIVKKTIVESSVCSKYSSGSIPYRRCISAAVETFDRRCDSYNGLDNPDARMWCDAYQLFKYR